MVAFAAVLAIVAQLSAVGAVANCDVISGLCDDETNLMQVKRIVDVGAHRQPVTTQTSATVVTQTQTASSGGYGSSGGGNNSEVEDAENAVKAAKSNSSIAKYALARANVNKANAIYDALKKSVHLEGADFESTNAGRTAKAAIQAAMEEELRWKRANDANEDAKAEAHKAEYNQVGKHISLHNATIVADDATALREAAEEHSKQVHIFAQRDVDRAAANESAYEAHEAKVAAAAAVAAAKEADEKAKEAEGVAKEESKEAHRSLNGAIHDEWHAASHSHRAQWAAMKAAAAGVDADLAKEVNVSDFANMNFSLLMVNPNSTDPVDIAMAKADAEVRASDAIVAEAASDEKVAKEEQDVQKYAAKISDWDEKKAHWHHDHAKMHEYSEHRHKEHADHELDEAMENDEVQDERAHSAKVAHAVADAMSEAAQNASHMRADAMRDAEALLHEALTKASAAKAIEAHDRVTDAAHVAISKATDQANDAAMARAENELDVAIAHNAGLEAKGAEEDADIADHEASDHLREVHHDEGVAAKQATAYQHAQALAIATNLSTLPKNTVLPTDKNTAPHHKKKKSSPSSSASSSAPVTSSQTVSQTVTSSSTSR